MYIHLHKHSAVKQTTNYGAMYKQSTERKDNLEDMAGNKDPMGNVNKKTYK